MHLAGVLRLVIGEVEGAVAVGEGGVEGGGGRVGVLDVVGDRVEAEDEGGEVRAQVRHPGEGQRAGRAPRHGASLGARLRRNTPKISDPQSACRQARPRPGATVPILELFVGPGRAPAEPLLPYFGVLHPARRQAVLPTKTGLIPLLASTKHNLYLSPYKINSSV